LGRRRRRMEERREKERTEGGGWWREAVGVGIKPSARVESGYLVEYG
jgi:hypothetical protein